MTKEMSMVVDGLVGEVLGGECRALTQQECDAICQRCPYRERCEIEALYWGCGVWEESMGEDL